MRNVPNPSQLMWLTSVELATGTLSSSELQTFGRSRGAAHRQDLARRGVAEFGMPISAPAADPVDAALPGRAGRGRCSGVPVDDPLSPLYPMKDCFERYVAAGLPRTALSTPRRIHWLAFLSRLAKAALPSCPVSVTDSASLRTLHARNACPRPAGKTFSRLSQASATAWISAPWLGRCCTSLLMQQKLSSAVCANAITCFWGSPAMAVVQSPLELARKVSARFEATPLWRMNPAWKRYLDLRLTKLPQHCNNNTEAQAHAALTEALSGAVMQGRARSLDLQLASRVACGALRGDTLVQALVTSFLMQTQQALARPDTVRHVADLEGVSQALGVLGRGAEFGGLLRAFHVNPRGLPKVVLDAPMFPQPFGSLSSREHLKSSFGAAASILRAVNRRLHVMMDETVWSAGFEQVRAMRDNSDFMVGGVWTRTLQTPCICCALTLGPAKSCLANAWPV